MVKTTINVSVDLRDKLIQKKLTKSETYDEIITRLLFPVKEEVKSIEDFQ